MIRLATERKTITITDLDELTGDQRADIDILLMILWKTCPVGCSANKDIFEDRQRAGEPEDPLSFNFLRASGL